MNHIRARIPTVRANKLRPTSTPPKGVKTPPLVDGMHLAADEFLRRYELMDRISPEHVFSDLDKAVAAFGDSANDRPASTA